MAQLVVFIAGLLVVAETQASDVADRSRFQGFLSHSKFITPSVNSAKHGNRVDALSSQVQDLPKVAHREESNNPISSSAIGMGLLSLVTMLGLHLRRRVQPAMSTASALGDNLMEMKSQDSHKMSSSKVGWGQLSSQNTRPSTLCYATETKADLEEIAKGLNPVVGYCVQANGIHWGTKMTLGGADWPTGTPPEQWDALPVASKWQIILFIGMLELFDESIEPHYMMGRKPGEYPKFSTAYMEGRGFPHPVPFDLFDPFGTVKKYLDTPEKRARGRLVEINNGRAAMLGIFGFLAASKVPGSVPELTYIRPSVGNSLVPFGGNFHWGGM
jgi:hypothetical protein